MSVRTLVVNADDFGRSPGITRGVLRAHAEGIVTSTSLMVRYGDATEEAVAAAAKESQVATLIGRRTAGAMLGADVIAVGGGWLVQIPVLDFRTAKGTRVERVGVTPDIRVKGRKAGEADADVERALKMLEHKQAVMNSSTP